jgi:formate hydrogenlyase transcriptional activator
MQHVDGQKRLPDEQDREVHDLEARIAEISSYLISLHCEQIDAAIHDAQKRICECLGLQRSALWEESAATSGALELTQIYQSHQPSGVPPIPEKTKVPISSISDQDVSPEYGRLHAEKLFPWATSQIRQKRLVVLSKIADLPPEAERDKNFFQMYATKSTLIIPLFTGEAFLGCVSFATTEFERTWPAELVKRFQLVGRLFGNVIARRRFEAGQRRTEERLILAADFAYVRPWELEIDTEILWTTASAREFYGVAAGEDLTLEHVLTFIHPEDREKLGTAIRNARQSGVEVNVDYRVVSPGGETRWMAGRGRLKRNASGQPESILGISIDITDRKRMEEDLKKGLIEIERLKLQLEKENLYLREELRTEQGHEKIVGESKAIKTTILRCKQVSNTTATVLLLGETGTGKGMVADAIHQMSDRKHHPMVTVNCASLPGNLIESELFGRERGAFTGAEARRAGRFEVADGGTIFLDEIGEMPLELQPKLLRVLQEGEFERLGSSKTIKVDVRVIAATSRDLMNDVRHGCFRQDLFYRLNVFPITIPPLRERAEDIPLLANHFVQKHARKLGKRIEGISSETIEMLLQYDWPGNVRELDHVLERAVIICAETVLRISEKLSNIPAQLRTNADRELVAVEREHIQKVLAETRWRIEGPAGAAEILNLKPSTLRFRIKKLGIKRPA